MVTKLYGVAGLVCEAK